VFRIPALAVYNVISDYLTALRFTLVILREFKHTVKLYAVIRPYKLFKLLV